MGAYKKKNCSAKSEVYKELRLKASTHKDLAKSKLQYTAWFRTRLKSSNSTHGGHSEIRVHQSLPHALPL